jgi:hypothetical protein
MASSRTPTPSAVPTSAAQDAESKRLADARARKCNWQRWGTYLPERQWGTVREDYSADGNVWRAFTYEMAQYRAYRWGEDGLLGWTDRECRLCYSTTLWNGNDEHLKERLFGLTNPEGNHGEDVKELYYYLDATPTHSYAKALYKYPQGAFPYNDLRNENARRGTRAHEYEFLDTGILHEDRYFDVLIEYAKQDPDETLIRISITNQGPQEASLNILPTLILRNEWSWNATDFPRPVIIRRENHMVASHSTLGDFVLEAINPPEPFHLMFTENETNFHRLDPNYGGSAAFTKDAFHRYVIHSETNAIASTQGTKAAFHFRTVVAPGVTQVYRLRLAPVAMADSQSLTIKRFEEVFKSRIDEADQFYARRLPEAMGAQEKMIARQAYAGLLWTKQFYHYIPTQWLLGDSEQPPPPAERRNGRNTGWPHLYCRDVLSMPDKWEYPWFAAWDSAFQMVSMAEVDPSFAKAQLLLMLREWYMHPSGKIPAYEFSFDDVNPPVHAWSVLQVYGMSLGADDNKDVEFLERAFQKLLLNFTWWVNRLDRHGNNLFGGGFLGLDNIGVFDRNHTLPNGFTLNQADGTAWMGFYCSCMLGIALELAQTRPVYEDIASKFFEHYIAVIDAMNSLGGKGLWDDQDKFFFDQLMDAEGNTRPIRVHSIVGLIPLFAFSILRKEESEKLPDFTRRLRWFTQHKPELAGYVGLAEVKDGRYEGAHFLALVPKERLLLILRRLLDETQFLSSYGVRALSRIHESKPFTIDYDGGQLSVEYAPGEGTSNIFGGNSNWRGPIWFPVNILLVEALERCGAMYGDTLKVECPVGSGTFLNLREIAEELARRLASPFLFDPSGRRPCHGEQAEYFEGGPWSDLLLFHEYFHAENGKGLGASHQTGWTALITTCLRFLHRSAEERQRVV